MGCFSFCSIWARLSLPPTLSIPCSSSIGDKGSRLLSLLIVLLFFRLSISVPYNSCWTVLLTNCSLYLNNSTPEIPLSEFDLSRPLETVRRKESPRTRLLHEEKLLKRFDPSPFCLFSTFVLTTLTSGLISLFNSGATRSYEHSLLLVSAQFGPCNQLESSLGERSGSMICWILISWGVFPLTWRWKFVNLIYSVIDINEEATISVVDIS